MNRPNAYTCRTCGQSCAELPLSFAADFPDVYANLPMEERDSRAVISSDQCIVDSKCFFLRGLVEIPIIGSSDVFLWGVWASVQEEVFDEISASWELEGREKSQGPFKGRLANSLWIYEETLHLSVTIVLRPVGARPLFVLEDSRHALGTQQQSGMTREQAIELAASLLRKLGVS
jgi:hypothetical protein